MSKCTGLCISACQGRLLSVLVRMARVNAHTVLAGRLPNDTSA